MTVIGYRNKNLCVNFSFVNKSISGNFNKDVVVFRGVREGLEVKNVNVRSI